MCSLAVAAPLLLLPQQQAVPPPPSAEMAASVEHASSSGTEPLAAGLELAEARHRLSMSPSHSKGLLNAPGQNNCFLNSAVQVSATCCIAAAKCGRAARAPSAPADYSDCSLYSMLMPHRSVRLGA